MDKKIAAERLRALASDDQKRSKAARLRDVINDVEAALSAGAARADVVNVLAGLGLEISLTTFETTLKRIRQKRRKPHVSSKEAAPAAAAPAESATSATGAHNPAEIDKIIGDKPDLDALAKLAKRNKR